MISPCLCVEVQNAPEGIAQAILASLPTDCAAVHKVMHTPGQLMFCEQLSRSRARSEFYLSMIYQVWSYFDECLDKLHDAWPTKDNPPFIDDWLRQKPSMHALNCKNSWELAALQICHPTFQLDICGFGTSFYISVSWSTCQHFARSVHINVVCIFECQLLSDWQRSGVQTVCSLCERGYQNRVRFHSMSRILVKESMHALIAWCNIVPELFIQKPIWGWYGFCSISVQCV